MIDQVFVMTLERTSDRYSEAYQRLRSKGVPGSKIIRRNGVDNVNFNKTRELFDFAIEEKGYSFLKRAVEIGLHNEVPITGFAQSLSYLDALRYSVTHQETIVILHDDRKLNRDYADIVDAMTYIPLDYHVVSIPIDYYFRETSGWQDFIGSALISEWGERFYMGFQTPSDNFIVSPLGAADMFARFSRMLVERDIKYYEDFLNLSIRNGEYHDTMYYCFNPDYFCLIDNVDEIPSLLYENPGDEKIYNGTTPFLRPIEDTRDE